MRSNLASALWGIVAIGGASGVLACSDHFSAPNVEPPAAGDAGAAGSDSSESLAGQAGADAGAGPEAGAAGVGTALACVNDAECDDGLRCNGAESCVAGTCRAGTPSPCSNAATCVEDTRWAACAYPDASPWLVYTADEDTPGVEELYAVKESLIGVQQPIKINGPRPVTAGKTPLVYSRSWTNDGTWFIYADALDDQLTVTRWYAVRFATGAPEAPIELTKDLPAGQFQLSVSKRGSSISSNGHDLLLYQPNGNLYRIDLRANGGSTTLKLNLDGEAVQDANWVPGGTVSYTTPTQAFWVNANGAGSRGALPGFIANLIMFPSTDDSHLSFVDPTNFDFYLAKAAPGEQISKVNHPSFSHYIDFRLSGDGNYVTYSASEQAEDRSEVYLVDIRQSSSWPRAALLQGQKLATDFSIGPWAPDSSYFVFFGDGDYPESKDVYVYDEATGSSRRLRYSIGMRDYVHGISPTGFVISDQRRSTDPSQLLLVTPSGEATELHRSALGKPYQGAQIAPNGTGVMFCSGESNEDLYYVDLRDAFHQVVQLPGQGSVSGCFEGFAPDSQGFAYYRVAPDGSRKLYWVDTAHQVLGKPVQVTRDGRARNWTWQPLATRTP